MSPLQIIGLMVLANVLLYIYTLKNRLRCPACKRRGVEFSKVNHNMICLGCGTVWITLDDAKKITKDFVDYSKELVGLKVQKSKE